MVAVYFLVSWGRLGHGVRKSIFDKSRIKTKKRLIVTRLIKCVAFWEMRNWAVLMASRTAKILFYGGETTTFIKMKIKCKVSNSTIVLLTGRSEAVRSRNLMLWFSALFNRIWNTHVKVQRSSVAVKEYASETQRKTRKDQHWLTHDEQRVCITSVLKSSVPISKYPQCKENKTNHLQVQLNVANATTKQFFHLSCYTAFL